MKTKLTGIFRLASLLLAMALVFSAAFTLVPASPVLATVSANSITSPTTGSPAYAKTNGSVTVAYSITCNTTAQGDLLFEVLQTGTSSVVVTYPINALSLSSGGNTGSYLVPLGAIVAGTYDIRFSSRQPSGSGPYFTPTLQTAALIVDNNPPVVTLTTPNGGEVVKRDGATDYTVTWNATDAIPAGQPFTVSALYSTDGSTFPPGNVAFAAVSRGQGVNNAPWPAANIPNVDTQTAKIQLTVSDAAGNSTVVTSASNFTIIKTAPTVVIGTPNSGTVWNGGTPQNIIFTTTSMFSLNVDYKIEVLDNSLGSPAWIAVTSGSSGFVLNQPAGLTTYAWNPVINNYRGTAEQIRITVRDRAGILGTVATSSTFTISDATLPTVSVTLPAAGTSLYVAGSTTIGWTANDNVITILGAAQTLTYNLALSTDGGSSYTSITAPLTAQPQGANTYPWTVPSVSASSTNCRIRVTATDGAGNVGTNVSATFSIFTPGTGPVVTISSPAGGESWTVGSTQYINFTANDAANPSARLRYDIYLNTGGGWGSAFASLTNQLQGVNSFTYAVPNSVSATCNIRVIATNTGSGLSGTAPDSNTFAIVATTSDCAVSTYSITLYQGWNLISLPAIPTTYNIDSLLSGIMPNVYAVYFYAGGSNPWQTYMPGGSSVPTPSLTLMVDGYSYWVKMTSGATLTFQGRKCPCAGSSPPAPYNYSTTGWNMLGFKSTVNQLIPTYLKGSCGATYASPIYSFNGSTQQWVTISCTDNLTPGSGYWIWLNSAPFGVIPGCY